MFTDQDLKQIEARGSVLKVVKYQIENFRRGFPYLELEKPATPGDGIITLEKKELENWINRYEKESPNKEIVKFVPASGAASRMFKLLYEFLEIASDPAAVAKAMDKSDNLQSKKTFFDRIQDFAFFHDLEAVLNRKGKSVNSCIAEKDYASILEALLNHDGLAYGSSPKGLLQFHKYPDGPRTSVMEHLAEGALYAQSAGGKVKIHFTVSPEHRQRFEEHIARIRPEFEKHFKVSYDISFSEQKAYTDTIAVGLDNEPFRNPDDSLLFRPAGHGALIENLNDIDADIIFVKNIDNVVPDKLKGDTISYKKALAGILLSVQEQIFKFLQLLDSGVGEIELNEMTYFAQRMLRIDHIPEFFDKKEAILFFHSKFNRPIRVCGMVKNEGEPGGGPFYALNADGTYSLQIVESSQIDASNPSQIAIANNATHFNPVDLVCAVKNYKGKPFDLRLYVDERTGFISVKSKDGKELKAQELPGLWNGSMSDWNTLFVEVPISTFNPVKTVNDLLRPQHQ